MGKYGLTKKAKLSTAVTGMLAVLLAIVFLLLFEISNNMIAGIMDEMAADSLTTALEAQALLMKQYISGAETQLVEFSKAPEVKELLLHPTDEDCYKRAQAYLDDYYAELGWEGLYIADWTSTQLAHITRSAIGKAFRTEEAALKAWQTSMQESETGLVNQGVFMSPSTGAMLLNMRMLVKDDNGTPIGAVGGGPFIAGLGEILKNFQVRGLENATYTIIDTASKLYVIGSDDSLVGKEVEDAAHVSILESTDGSGVINADGMVTAYVAIPEQHIVMLMSDSATEIYQKSAQVKVGFGSFCVITFIALVILVFLLVRLLTKPLGIVENAVNNLGSLSLKKDEKLRLLTGGKSEISSIATSVSNLTDTWIGIVDSMDDCVHSMSGETDAMVDTAKSLIDCAADNMATTEELSASMTNTNESLSHAAGEVQKITDLIADVNARVEDGTKKSKILITAAGSMSDSTDGLVTTTEKKLVQTKQDIKAAMDSLKALSNINMIADRILEITDQTSLLSLNASIEAARAGDSGRGFAVVAGEIGSLATNSQQSVNEIQAICNETTNSIDKIEKCFNDIVQFLENDISAKFVGLSAASKECREGVEELEQAIGKIEQAAKGVSASANSINSQIQNVGSASLENERGIEQIIEKAEFTNEIAEKVNTIVSEQQTSAGKIEDVIQKFTK